MTFTFESVRFPLRLAMLIDGTKPGYECYRKPMPTIILHLPGSDYRILQKKKSILTIIEIYFELLMLTLLKFERTEHVCN